MTDTERYRKIFVDTQDIQTIKRALERIAYVVRTSGYMQKYEKDKITTCVNLARVITDGWLQEKLLKLPIASLYGKLAPSSQCAATRYSLSRQYTWNCTKSKGHAGPHQSYGGSDDAEWSDAP